MNNYANEIRLTPKQLAERLGMSISSLQSWRVSGKGPRFIKLEAKILYPLADVIKWENRLASKQPNNNFDASQVDLDPLS